MAFKAKHGVFCMVYIVWCILYGIFCIMYFVWYIVYDILCMMYSTWYIVCNALYWTYCIGHYICTRHVSIYVDITLATMILSKTSPQIKVTWTSGLSPLADGRTGRRTGRTGRWTDRPTAGQRPRTVRLRPLGPDVRFRTRFRCERTSTTTLPQMYDAK